ncbi:hypothetical protein [Streptomyces sp. P17]|uniref:hypothetical protein n=1 Tax=Streptomyces sp. P17 TaxID=3074716 RepID=UPI0028F42748|nr:hypothetical protein [Streptomyces sp. P17]MDT9697233.1 hypothetical protein [Streptomyces sp. P17]
MPTGSRRSECWCSAPGWCRSGSGRCGSGGGSEDRGDAGIVVGVVGHATVLRLPKLLDALEALPRDRAVRLELGRLRHLDHACAAALEGWAAARGARWVAGLP